MVPTEGAVTLQQARMAAAFARARCFGPRKGEAVCEDCIVEGAQMAALGMRVILAMLDNVELPTHTAEEALERAVNGWVAGAGHQAGAALS